MEPFKETPESRRRQALKLALMVGALALVGLAAIADGRDTAERNDIAIHNDSTQSPNKNK